jgi:hypothetical protein
MMKKMTGLAAILLATMMIAAPLTADAGFNIGGVLNKIPGVSTDKGKVPSVPLKTAAAPTAPAKPSRKMRTVLWREQSWRTELRRNILAFMWGARG